MLNTGDPSLAGFRLAGRPSRGVPGARRELAEADPAQVGFSPDGTALVVTQRGTDSIAVYPVDSSGLLGEPARCRPPGRRRTGSRSRADGTLVVTEAFGAAGRQGGRLLVRRRRRRRSRPCPARSGTAAARSAGRSSSKDDRYAFTTNFADGAVSRYAIGADGAITLEDAAAGIAVDGQTGLRDEDISADGRFLYAVDADSRRVFGWAVGDGGSLDPIGSWDGLPATVAGLAAS